MRHLQREIVLRVQRSALLSRSFAEVGSVSVDSREALPEQGVGSLGPLCGRSCNCLLAGL